MKKFYSVLKSKSFINVVAYFLILFGIFCNGLAIYILFFHCNSVNCGHRFEIPIGGVYFNIFGMFLAFLISVIFEQVLEIAVNSLIKTLKEK